MKKILMLLMLSCIGFGANCQSSNRHEVGFNIAGLFKAKPTLAGIYRYERGKTSYRLLAGGYWDNGFSSDAINIQTAVFSQGHKHTSYLNTGTELRLGMQHKFFIHENWYLYKGLDFGFDWNLEQQDITTRLPNGFGSVREEKNIRNNYYYYSLSPLLGIRFFLWPQISVSAEAAFPFYRYISFQDEQSLTFITDNVGVERLTETNEHTNNTDGWKFEFNNQSLRIFISFQF